MEFAVEGVGNSTTASFTSSSPRQHLTSSPRPPQQTWASRPTGVASLPPQSPVIAAITTMTALPPLLDAPASPRREPLVPPPLAASAASLQTTLERDYPVAQLDSWPLTSRASYKRRFAGHQQQHQQHQQLRSPEPKPLLHLSPPAAATSANEPASSSASPQILRIGHSPSPISPRQRKTLQRHALLDESKSKPLLLQELQAFVSSELAELARQQRLDAPPSDDAHERSHHGVALGRIPHTSSPPSLARLQVFREAFERVIASFSAYAPVLAQIRDEYERVVAQLRAQCLQVPALHAQLKTLQTQCVHEIAVHNVETAARSHALRQQLRATQARLTARAAQNAELVEQSVQLRAHVETLERRGAEMQLSNNSLVHGMKRHDDTLRHIHERSREEGMALAQMASKYHHACDEIAELKRTIASLEERVGGVHVAADKATIALLARELQDTHAQLQTAQRSAGAAAVAELQQSLAQHSALSHAFVKVLEAQSVNVSVHELLAIVRRTRAAAASDSADPSARVLSAAAPAAGELVDATDAVVAAVLEKLAAQTRPLDQLRGTATTATPATAAPSATFLTEPEETLSLDAATRLLSTTDLLPGRGFGADVPEYLQFDGAVRNLRFSRKRLEQIVARVWQQKDELEKTVRGHLCAAVTGATLTAMHHSNNNSSGSGMPLAKVFTMMLQRMCPSKAEAIESAYNIVAALERFAPRASDCRLFLAVLQGEIPEDARSDQLKEIYGLHDALAALEKDRTASNSSSSTMGGAGGRSPPGRVSLADVIQLLRQLFPWKTDAALSALHRALLFDQRGHAHIDYTALLLQQDDKRLRGAGPGVCGAAAAGGGGRGNFVECLRTQYIDDLLAYRRHLQMHIQQRLLARGDVASVSANGSCSTASELPMGDSSTTPPLSSSTTSPASPSVPTASNNSDASTPSAMVSIRELRDVLQECDSAKPVQEINRLLAIATALSMDQILTQDTMMVNAQQFLRKLPTLLVKPAGKFYTGSSSGSDGASTVVGVAALPVG